MTAKRPSLRRRILKTALALVGMLFLLRIALQLTLPWIADQAVAGLGLRLDMEKASISVLGGEIRLRGLAVSPRAGGKPFASVDFLEADFSVGGLLDDPIAFERIVLDGVRVELHRESDGRWAFLKHLTSSEPSPEAEEPADAQAASIDPTSGLPIRIGALRLINMRIELRDETVSPAYEQTVTLDVHGDRVGSVEGKTKVRLMARAFPLFDLLVVEAADRAEVATDLSFLLEIEGCRPESVARYLEQIGIRPVAEKVSAGVVIEVSLDPPGQDVLAADLMIRDARLEVEHEKEGRLDRLEVKHFRLGADGSIRTESVFVRGARAALEVLESGNLRIGGFELLVGGDDEEDEEGVAVALPDEGPAPVIDLGDITVEDFQAGVNIENDLPLQANVTSLTAKGFRSDGEMELDVTFSSPGLTGEITASGRASVLTTILTADLAVEVEGANIAVLRDDLLAGGIRTDIEKARIRGNFGFRLDPTGDETEFDFDIRDVRLSEESELFRAGRVRVTSAIFGGDHFSFEEVEISGVKFEGTLDPSGGFRAFGLAFLGDAGDGGSEPAADSPTEPDASVPPRFDVGKISLADSEVVLVNERVDPPEPHRIHGLTLEGTRLGLGGGPGAAPEGGEVHLKVAADGLAEAVSVDGSVAASGGRTTFDLKIEGRGLTFPALEVRGGALKVDIDGALTVLDDGIEATLGIADLAVEEGGGEVLRLESGRVGRFVFHSDRIAVEDLELVGPVVRARRDADGGFHLPWFHIAPSGDEPPTEDAGGESEAPTTTSHAPVVAVTGAKVSDLRVHWTDETLDPPVEADLEADLKAADLSIDAESLKADASVEIHLPQTGSRLGITGSFEKSPEGESVEVALSGRGLRSGSIDRYAGGQTVLALEDGRLEGKIRVERGPAPEGGRRARLLVTDLSVKDGEDGPPLLAAEDLRVKIDRFDRAQRVLAVDAIVARGLVAEIHREADGTTRFGGLLFRPPPPPEGPTDLPAKSRPETVEEFRDRLRLMLEDETPLVTLQTLDVEIARFALVDETRERPLVFEDVRLRNARPLVALGDNPDEQPGLEFRVEGKVSPVAESIVMTATARPFAAEPQVEFHLSATGLTGLTFLIGELPEEIDLGRLHGGSIQTDGDIKLRMRRENPFSYDFTRQFGAAFHLENFEMKDREQKTRLSFDELRVAAPVIDLPRSSVILRRIALSSPEFDCLLDEEGLHVAGLLIRSSPDEESPTAEAPASGPPGPAPTAETTGSGLVAMVESLHIYGLDATFTNARADPPTVIPITDLEVAVRGFSTRAFEEPLPVTFSLESRSAPVSLPTSPPRERDAFQDLSVAGRLTLTEHKDGWVTIGLNSLELPNFLGMAGEEGVQLRGGILDFSGRWRFQQDDTVDVRLELALTDLNVSEPTGGSSSPSFASPLR